MLSAEIIAIGSELLSPNKSDTNSLWLTDQLNRIGIDVKLKTIVGDDDARLEEVVKDAVKRSRVVIATGGLGPTEDDITRKVVARALGRRLSLDEKLLEEIRTKFQRFGMNMPERNSRQAMVIDGAEVLAESERFCSRTLPGAGSCAVALLPGPPREMKPMFENHVKPRLEKIAGDVRFATRLMRVTGMGESAVDEKISPIYTQFDNPQTTILFNSSEDRDSSARAWADRRRCRGFTRSPVAEDRGGAWQFRLFISRRDDGRSSRSPAGDDGIHSGGRGKLHRRIDCATSNERARLFKIFH